MMYDFELINLTTRVKLKEWIKNLTFIEPDEKTTTLLRNWLLWDFISQCDRSTDSNNLKVAVESSPHAGKLLVTPLFKNGLECDPCNFCPISVLPTGKKNNTLPRCALALSPRM